MANYQIGLSVVVRQKCVHRHRVMLQCVYNDGRLVKYSCGAVVVAEQTAQTFPAPNTPTAAAAVIPVMRLGEEQDISLSLMVPLNVEMLHKFCKRAPQRAFAEKN